MKTTRQKRAAPFYAAAAVWLAYALVLPLYEPLHYALAAGASLLAFAAERRLARRRRKRPRSPLKRNRPLQEILSWTRWSATGRWPSGR